jgi:hypothetical protein
MALINKPDISKIWASTGSKVAPLDAKIATGWIQEMMPAEWENFLQNRTDVMLNHISQRGIPEWDAVTEYQAGRSYVTSSSGTVYRAVTTNTNISPSSDSGTNWVKAFVTTGDVFVSSTGNIGIGTTTPTGKLDVRGNLVFGSSTTPLGAIFNDSLAVNVQANTSATGGLKVGTSSATPLSLYTNGIGRVTITADGFVGVGISAPTAKFGVDLTGSSGVVQQFRTITSPSTIAIGATGGGIEIGWGSVASSIRAVHGGDGNHTGMAFSTAASGTTTERMRIDSAGSVGIGISGPLNNLHVHSQTSAASVIRATDSALTSTGTNGGYLAGYSTVGQGGKVEIGTLDSNSYNTAIVVGSQASLISFRTSTGVNGTTTERAQLTTTGFGIGISPATKLHASVTGADCEARIETITSGNPRLSLNASGTIYNWLQTNRSTGALEFAVSNTVVAALDVEGGFRLKYAEGGGGIGYGAGTGGAVTQATSRTTGVTVNKPSGAITLFTAAGSATPTTFTVTNSAVTATDVVNISIKSATNIYAAFVTATNNGSFNVTFYSLSGTASDAPVINFAVLKAVAV